ncbi:amidohydrolase [Tsukamurella soli]|uniref:Peptidase M20 domain-containing protein 2 n=1 Tax=Tsukamurella soli TaxID=644556 RepID=A0ABP8K8I9_9ACTN
MTDDAPRPLLPQEDPSYDDGLTPSARMSAELVATELHAHPELSMQERRSAGLLRRELAAGGFAVADAPRCPTAFVASAGTARRRIALCLEYDALPGIGHACGHHLIAGAGIAAALSLLPELQTLDLSLRVVGTPGEERGGGKVILLERNVFDGVEAALMVHFVPEGFSANPAGTSSYAVGRERVTFTGRAAHAAAAPHEGRNAGDATVIAQVAIGVLRQQTRPEERIGLHVVSGGLSTNIIPAESTMDFECRSTTWAGYTALRDRVLRCIHAAAYAAECEYRLEQLEPAYQPLEQNEDLAAIWSRAIARRGHRVDRRALPTMVSTDMGNVSRHMPSVHPWLSIPGVTAPIHTAEFADASIGPAAVRTMLDAAAALADTVRALA